MSSGSALSNWIQIITICILAVNLIVITRQLVIQNRVSKMHLMKDRFDMYRQAYQPISDDRVKTFHVHHEDHMPDEIYESKYKNDNEAARRYLFMAQLFVYLAFVFYSRKQGIRDPLGKQWLSLWALDLAVNKEFLELKDYYRPYYPAFSRYLDDLLKKTG